MATEIDIKYMEDRVVSMHPMVALQIDRGKWLYIDWVDDMPSITGGHSAKVYWLEDEDIEDGS